MEAKSTVFAIEKAGLENDRYATKKGYFQNVPKPRVTHRDVSLISAAAIENSGFQEEETRRNIVVNTTMNLTDLIGERFKIGQAVLEGTEDCTPCERPSNLSGKPGFAKAFHGKGGIRAKVIESGEIKIRDELVLLSDIKLL